MDRLLRNSTGVIRVTITDSEGEAAVPTGQVTATIFDSAGVQMGAPVVAAAGADVGVYEATLGATFTAVLDNYTATWSATVAGNPMKYYTEHDVVGANIISIPELRAWDTDLNAADYPSNVVRDARNAAEDRLEYLTGVAWRPRGRRWITNGTNGLDLYLPDLEPRLVVSATLDTGSGPVALTAGEIADLKQEPSGRLTRQYLGVWTIGRRNITILYEHGLDGPIEPIRYACKLLTRAALVPSAVPDRALSLSTGEGNFRLSTAGRDGPTGLPEVDAIIEQHGRWRPTVGEVEPDPLGRSRSMIESGIYPWTGQHL